MLLPPLWIFLPLLGWLGVVSVFDLRTREVPHSAWTGAPFALAALYRALNGGALLALIAAALLVVSERRLLQTLWLRRLGWRKRLAWGRRAVLRMKTEALFILTGMFFLALLAGEQTTLAAALLVIFWLLFERGLIGGADGLTGMVILLVLPVETGLFWAVLWLAFGALTVLGWRVWHRARPAQLNARLPGLPVMLAATLALGTLDLVAPNLTAGKLWKYIVGS